MYHFLHYICVLGLCTVCLSDYIRAYTVQIPLLEYQSREIKKKMKLHDVHLYI